MADFDPESLTWKVFANVVREKHGHALVADRSFGGASCARCGLLCTAPDRLRYGWLTSPSGGRAFGGEQEKAERCPGTRPS